MACEEASRGYWANSKKGSYGQGLGRTDGDPWKPVRTGLLGEMAWARLFCEPLPSFRYRKGGDGGADFRTGDFSWDIKVAMRDYGTGLIYQKNQWGKVIPLKADIYVFGYVAEEYRPTVRSTAGANREPLDSRGSFPPYPTQGKGSESVLDPSSAILGGSPVPSARVVLVGFATREQVPQIGEVKPGRKGSGHLNWELKYPLLGDMVELRRRKLARFGSRS